MIFFDNQTNNCQDVSKVNVTVAYVPDGITRLETDLVLSIVDCYMTKFKIQFSGAHSKML